MPDFNRYGSIIDFQNRTNAPMGAISYKEPLTKGGHLCKRPFANTLLNCKNTTWGTAVLVCGHSIECLAPRNRSLLN